MPDPNDLYVILGIPPDATADEIMQAYRRQLRYWHPDLRKDPEAEHSTNRLNAAHATLSDPTKRAEYDRRRGAAPPPPPRPAAAAQSTGRGRPQWWGRGTPDGGE